LHIFRYKPLYCVSLATLSSLDSVEAGFMCMSLATA